MTDMLIVIAFELRPPVTVVILVVTRDLSFHFSLCVFAYLRENVSHRSLAPVFTQSR
jgi:phosphatidylglycerophosphate synthase